MRKVVEASVGKLEPARFEDRYVEVGGLRLHYLDYGTAGKPLILCVHGGAAQGHWFDFFAPDFRSDYHVIALDLPGHGDSDWLEPDQYSYFRYAATVDAFVRALDLRDFVYFGHSMGGLIGIVYVAEYPERVRALVVADSTLHLQLDRIGVLRDVGSKKGSTFATKAELESRFRLRPAGPATPEVIRHLAQFSGRQLEDGSWTNKFDRHTYSTRQEMDGFPYFPRIAAPTFLVKAELSPRLVPEVVDRVRVLKPDIQFAEVPNADHHLFLDNPRGFEKVMRAFLQSLGDRC
ncbi:MAG: alpha/beta hydrolase [Chloroflexi bacterium]|nr:alpha/beta hydrolase [Chloroflexota bacterium]